MENNWYESNHPENDATDWYAPTAAVGPEVPVRRAGGWMIALILFLILALIAASCFFVLRFAPAHTQSDSRGESGGRDDSFAFTFPGPDDERDSFYDDFRDFFDQYYTAYEPAEPCEIPVVQARDDLRLTLVEPAGETLTRQEIYDKCSPSIVAISAYTDPDSDDYYSWGTGIIFSSDGYVVTNAHIVEGTCRATITLQNDEEYEALLVGCDSRSDIAILKIDAAGLTLTSAEFASSDALQVGDDVVAIGNPLGASFRCTMTNGIISGIDRDIAYNGTTLTLIQTNAALNEGNSGGALINMYGQVIGITNMKMSNSYAGAVTIEGVGFAIPSATVQPIADALLADGAVIGRPALGITVGAIPESAAAQYSLPEGLYVSAVAENSDCAAKGLQSGDIITHVNGKPCTVTADITELIAEMTVGDTLTFTVYRASEERTFEITVELIDMNEVY